MPLNLAPNIADPDGFYQELIDSQRDLDESAAALMNARLVLLRESVRRARRLGAGRVRLALVADTAECLEAAERIVAFCRG